MATKHQPGQRISEYLLETCLGVGSFGEVWRARHHVWAQEFVAIKLPTQPDYVRYLRAEGVMVHGLRHPNIVRVLGLDPYADTPYLVMELVDGPSLAGVVREHPRGIGIEPALNVLRGLLAGIDAAHAAGVLHRDLKPGNVLLNLAGRPLTQATAADVRVSDFGLGLSSAEALASVVQSASLARDNKLVGTLAYMAPELREGQRQADARADLFAVGIILFEMLCGERPAGAELPSTLRADVTPALDDVFRRLYARYDHRYASARAVLDDVDKLARPRPPLAAYGGRLAAGGPVTPPPIPRTVPGATFEYLANDAAGRRVRGEVEGDDCGSAAGILRDELGLHPLNVGLKQEGARPANRCPGCGGATASSDQFCTNCGRQLVERVRRCAACGAYPGPEDRFCILCGVKLEGATSA